MLSWKRSDNNFIAHCSIVESAAESKTMVERENTNYVKAESHVSQDDIVLSCLSKVTFHIYLGIEGLELAMDRVCMYIDYTLVNVCESRRNGAVCFEEPKKKVATVTNAVDQEANAGQ